MTDLLPPADEGLYEPLLRPAWRLGHLGQSLDGFIGTAGGRGDVINGAENLDHLHRLRALADAVVVGAGTVAADDPQLTVRRVPGRNPVRVVIDPRGALEPGHRLFQDGAAPTLQASLAPGRAPGLAERLTVAEREGTLSLADLVEQLAARGLARIFVEGGGVTVSRFLAAGQLDRLQLCVAPLLLGGGKRGLGLPPAGRMAEAWRAPCRCWRMGPDVLFDFDLAAQG
ncbi:riboflavin-specific deaminase C-terminal domain-containing protein [Tistlia consotensis]|uniref:Riboflavin-specific deaminase C-terminal domain-containing protein n=1 Tax=Tistlia consotensis USBA 355 TaxID=560819 RepID=A0A1Y6BN04_9PROT|nr:RibD family protein [Tistlia consotensis]SMF11952.1 riboflavin-specific deaminase C-terminal domain-containing protein [Tistlia consotensis USBA 355]SNR51493.1 riboflavin-specific deaminase C-terminal domain-containing protein [Tistlia consotensis]